MSQQEQVNKLISQIERRTGHPLRGNADYKYLVGEIHDKLNKTVSTSTIKRMLGKVSDQHEPSLVTLDTLSQFLGYRHWQDFVNRSSECDGEVSQFLNKDVVMCSDLNEGDMVEITWSPARLCRMRCVGLGRFEVTMSINSKLAEGDTISCQMLAVGQPFTATNVRRGTRLEKVYVAATDGGISSIKLLPRPI